MTKKPADPAWLAEIEDIRPLGSKKPPTPALPKMPPPTNPQPLAPPPYRPATIGGWNENPPFPIQSNTAQLISGHHPNFDKPLFKKLSLGQIRPTAILDLHGLGEGDAWLQLVDFLHECTLKDHRCALIIHGKGTGYGPNRDMGVIKVQIAAWLAGHPKVQAFHTALPQDGGSGALYAYLKRHP